MTGDIRLRVTIAAGLPVLGLAITKPPSRTRTSAPIRSRSMQSALTEKGTSPVEAQVDLFSEQFDQYTSPSSQPPQDTSQYLLAPRAMENAMLKAMGAAPTKPVVKKRSAHQADKQTVRMNGMPASERRLLLLSKESGSASTKLLQPSLRIGMW